MPLKLFITGLPGSGKSAISRFIMNLVSAMRSLNDGTNWVTTRFNDYPILYSMFTDDKEEERFEAASQGGFNVLNFTAFDEALKLMGKWITWHIASKQVQSQELLLIEFARNDYHVAFSQFKQDVLQDAYFIYLRSDVEVCQQRISERVTHPEHEEDDYPVSRHIFQTYYYDDDGFRIVDILTQEFGIAKEQILALDNSGSLADAKAQVGAFVRCILACPDSTIAYEKQTDCLVSSAKSVSPAHL